MMVPPLAFVNQLSLREAAHWYAQLGFRVFPLVPGDKIPYPGSRGVHDATDNPDADLLYFVGCSGSFDDRGKKIAQAMARVLQKADVNFAILGPEEACNGDVARRAGNEYIAQMLMMQNGQMLAGNRSKQGLQTAAAIPDGAVPGSSISMPACLKRKKPMKTLWPCNRNPPCPTSWISILPSRSTAITAAAPG